MKLSKTYYVTTLFMWASVNSSLVMSADAPYPIPRSSMLKTASIVKNIKPNYEADVTDRNTTYHSYQIMLDRTNIIELSNNKTDKNQSSTIHYIDSSSSVNALKKIQLEPPPVYAISLDSAYRDNLSSIVPEKWYVFNVATKTKITSLLQQIPVNHDYDMLLYSMPKGETAYNFYAGSYMTGSSNEQLSTIAVPGDYLLIVRAVSTPSTDSFVFGNFSSSGYDNNEPDDNFWLATSQPSNVGVNGNLDYSGDKDFHSITLPQTESINYSITGGDYQAELFYPSGRSAFILQSNSFARLTLPPNTYYWSISSPSGETVPETSYTFSAYSSIDNITFDFDSDEYDNGYKVDYGKGSHFTLYKDAIISGYAYDSVGLPVVGATIMFTLEGSVGKTEVATATTNAQGRYSTTIVSPTGAGTEISGGPCYDYHWDEHTLKIQAIYGNFYENIPSLKVNSTTGPTTQTRNWMKINDIAYSIYTGC